MNTRNARQNSSLTQRILFGLATATICFGSVASPVYAIDANTVPTGGTGDTGVIINAATTDTNNQTTMNITQTVNNAVINWGTFNVGSNATINFIQTANGLPNTAAMTLNRVASTGGMSEIAGNINSIGTFILINPNGIMFDGTSTVNAAGIIASTANITDENFKAGKLIFEQNGTIDGNITVNGKLNASTNGSYLGDVNGNSGMLKTAYEALNDSTILNTSKLQPAAGFSIGNNVIKLVADGDITVGSAGSLQAVTTTNLSGTSTVGTEEYTVEGSGSTREGSILLRADQNVNELALVDTNATSTTKGTTTGYDSAAVTRYAHNDGTAETASSSGTYKVAKVYLDNTNASQIASQHVGVYYEPDITNAGINGTTKASIGITAGASGNFTQKDYTKYSTEATAYLGKITETPTIISNSLSATDTASNTVSTSKTADRTISMLVNNVYQLQAIQDVSGLTGVSGKTYYGNLGGGYAQGTTISAAETANWTSNGMSGFDPIGTNSNAFTGHFTGNGGSDTYGIYDLHILHSISKAEDSYAGLFASMDKASIWSTTLIDPVIQGYQYVGGIAGYADSSTIQGTTVRKRNGAANSDGADTVTATKVNVQGNSDYVGGLVGMMNNSTISRYSSNESTVTGAGDYVGGLVGVMTNTSKITDSHNKGYTSDATNLDQGQYVGVITGTNNVGGLAGAMDGTASIGVSESKSSSYNSGQVNGTTDVGGLVGSMASGTSITQAYNTNEATTLGTVLTAVPTTTSLYGKVTGTSTDSSNIGGLVGAMAGGSITTAYNAGDVSGNTAVGGLVGSMTGGTIAKAYNGDNNTVLVTAAGAGGKMDNDANKAAEASYVGFTVTQGDGTGNNINGTYTYVASTQTWTKTVNGTTITGISTSSLPAETLRLYNNRLAYRDATVTGTTNVGGLVGNMTAGAINQAYNEGKVKGGAAATTGALIGLRAANTTVGKDAANKVFYATTNEALSATDKANTVSDGNNFDMGVFGTDSVTTGTTNTEGVTLNALTQAATEGWTDGTSPLSATATQNNDWIVYSNSSAPLLKAFMTSININRQYRYDGTTHNLITSDVGNYYGGAFFSDGSSGKNVHTSDVANVKNYNASDWVIKTGSASDSTTNSSVYKYASANMWSPQHAYYTKSTAAVIITPEPVTVTAAATKNYGQLTKGYVYYDGTSKYYTYDSNNSKWITTNAPVAGTAYIVTVSTLAGSEDPLTVLANLNDLSVKDAGSGITSFANKAADTDNQKTNAASTAYALDMSSSSVQGQAGNTQYNYAVTYNGKLTVNKADLVVSMTGNRVYGNANTTGTYTYSASNGTGTTTEDADNSGKLKSWDTIDGSITKDTSKLVMNTGANVTHNGTSTGSTKIGTNADVVGTTTDNIWTLGSYTLTNDTVVGATSTNYNLIFDTTKGSTGTMTITPRPLTYDVVGSNTYGSAVSAYSVTARDTTPLMSEDQIGNVVTATELSTLAETVKNKYQITAATHVVRTDAGAVTTYKDEAVSTAYSDGNAGVSAKNHNYSLTAGNFKYTIDPADVTYTVNDLTKTYGQTLQTGTATGTWGSFVNGETIDGANNTTKVYGLNEGDSVGKADVTAAAYTIAANELEDDVNPGLATTGVKYSGSSVAAYAGTIKGSGLYLNDYNVNYVNGGVTINPAPLAVTAGSGTKVYGDANSTIQYTDVTFSGFQNSDEASLGGTAGAGNFTSALTADSGITETSNAGTHAAVTTASLTSNADSYKNYTISYDKNDLVITPREVTYTVDDVTRAYGGDTTFTGHYNNVVNNDTVGTVDQKGYSVTGGDTILSHTDVGSICTITTTETAAKNGITNTNYKLAATNPITNTGSLTITKADLYFTANGERVYGTTNGIDTIKSITAVKTGTADTDALNNGAIKSWDVSDRGIANLAGYTKPNEVSLIATENARTGSTTTSTTIGTPTWVKGSAVSPQAYSLAKGSFQNADGTNQFTSKNYNLIYIGNTQGGAASGTYTITPLTASYNVTTNSVYGSGVRTNETSTILDQHEQTITGEAQTALLDGLAKQFDLIHQHVTGETPSAVTKISTEAGGLVGNPNYLLTGGSYTYTITPASVTYKANDDSWTSGLTSPDQPLSGGFIDGRNGDRIVTDGIGLSTTITSASPVGTYLDSIFAKGPAHAGSAGNLYDYYVMYRPGTMVVNAASDPVYDAAIHGVLPTTKASQDIANQLSGKDGAGMTVKAGDAAGGYIPREARDSIRFVTIEDTGVNLQMVSAGNTTITIDAASQIGGSGAITITGSGEAHSIAGTATATEVAQQMAADEKLAASSKLVQASNIAVNSDNKDVTSAAENGTGTEALPAVEAAPADSTTVTAVPESPANAPTDTAAAAAPATAATASAATAEPTANAPAAATASPSAETASVQSVKATAATENTNTKEEQKKRRSAAEQ